MTWDFVLKLAVLMVLATALATWLVSAMKMPNGRNNEEKL